MTPTDSQAARLHEELARVLALLKDEAALRNDGELAAADWYACQFERQAAIFLRKHGAHIAETFKETPNG